MVHVLGLDDGLEVVFQNLGEVVLELRAAEVGEDFLPVRRVLFVMKWENERRVSYGMKG